uniref:hypothetical protein n=1 Tax=Candidatus Vondammii sp. HM_W22 TaxID=2687299 RepID=UPI001F13BE39|nr:hypothetical protein [Candidatus Vondammii sp. HM_W22]
MNEREQEADRKRSRVRARVEHVFAQQANRLVRSIGQGKVGVNIGMMNLIQHASIGVASRMKRSMDLDVARKMRVIVKSGV